MKKRTAVRFIVLTFVAGIVGGQEGSAIAHGDESGTGPVTEKLRLAHVLGRHLLAAPHSGPPPSSAGRRA